MFTAIIIIVVAFIVYLIVFHHIKEWIHRKVINANPEKAKEVFYKKHPSARQYIGEEHEWKPTYNLEHHGVTIFNIPFVPDENEKFTL